MDLTLEMSLVQIFGYSKEEIIGKKRVSLFSPCFIRSNCHAPNLNTYFSNWFSKDKDRFELYEVSDDYYEANNLIHNSKYEGIFKTLQHNLFAWIEESDFGNMSESAMLDSMFTKSMSIPKLNIPEIIINGEGFLIESNNLHASVGWRNKNETVWNIYTTNELIQPKDDFEVVVFRPGYEVLIQVFEK